MIDAQAPLKNFEKRHEFLICIDSDGCVFDTMEIKHKECFIPNIVKYWELQAISKYARAASEFVNLYSKWRGSHRMIALVKTFDLLEVWPETRRRQCVVPRALSLRNWVQSHSNLGNPALREEVQRTGDSTLALALDWSEAVNASVAEMVHDIPPFPFVRESLRYISEWADIIVCSATPQEALAREWEEHGIAKYATVIAGQEMGSKKEHIALALEGRYENQCVLMIGDAPGDLKAAQANGACFFPINPGAEEASWEAFFVQVADKFRLGQYTRESESAFVRAFDELLPENPGWICEHVGTTSTELATSTRSK
jgi:phosphoglycolate phosphatase-like HAD superfamily hydrolase